MKRGLLILLLLSLSWAVAAQTDWQSYANKRFGYKLELPAALQVTNRAADGSGVTWQTGTFRVQASGLNNPYSIKPHEYFARIKASAADRVVEDSTGYEEGKGYWYVILYTKDGRRVHQKTYIGGKAINTLEVSYAYRYRKEKERIGKQILSTFQPGDLVKGR